jgi:hypothetical protein
MLKSLEVEVVAATLLAGETSMHAAGGGRSLFQPGDLVPKLVRLRVPTGQDTRVPQVEGSLFVE